VANVNGKTVWIIYGSRLPMTVLDKERVFRFMLLQLEDLVDFPFTILYVHTDTSYAENCPGLSWMQHKMSKLPDRCFESIDELLLLHPDLHFWLCLHILRGSILGRLW